MSAVSLPLEELERRLAGSSIAAVARDLGVPRRTLSDYVAKLRGKPEGDGLPTAIEEVEIPVFFRDYSHLPKLRLYPLGDVHKGSSKHQGETWRQWVEYLRETKHASMLGTGDFFNAGLKDSKSESYDEVMTVGQAGFELREELKPLADEQRIDLLMPGNHEDRVYRAVGLCPVESLAYGFDVAYARESALIVYRVGDQQYEVYVRHGTGNGQSLIQLEKGHGVISADLYITGHTHKQGIVPGDHFHRVGDRVVRRHHLFVGSGSFIGYEGYAATRGYKPTRIGAPRLYLSGTEHDFHASI